MSTTKEGAAVTAPTVEINGSVPHARHAALVRRLDDLYRIVPPREMCYTLGLRPGSSVSFEVRDGGILMRPWVEACAVCHRMPSEGVFDLSPGVGLCRSCARDAAMLHARLEGEA